MAQAYSWRADGSVNLVHLPGCALLTSAAMVCTCAEIEREADVARHPRMSTMCGSCGNMSAITADGRHFIAHPGRNGQPCPGDHDYPTQREQVLPPDPGEWDQGMTRLGVAMAEVSKSLGSLALLIKLHGWLINKRQVDAETVALAAVGRLPVTVTGRLVQVDLRPDKPPYVVLREEYGSEIPVAPESVRAHVTPLLDLPSMARSFSVTEEAGGWCAPSVDARGWPESKDVT